MRKEWKPRGPLPEIVGELEIPKLIWQALYCRGYKDKSAVEHFFSASLKDLRNPFLLRDLDKAVVRLITALENQEHICVYADFDLDGTSGLALLYEGLKLLGYKNLSYYQPRRLAEGYGVHKHAIEQIAQDGAKILITVDVGITAFEALTLAQEKNMEVIITDHHLPEAELPPALAVVNPNRRDCTSQLGHLSGAGVAFYLLMGLRRKLLDAKKLATDFDPKTLLDCFVIGTLSDMVPLIEENRILTKHGLLQLSQTKRLGLKKLLTALSMQDRPLSSLDVAIGFVPKLNALSRMDNGVLPVDLFLVDEEKKADEMLEVVFRNNELRKNLQQQAVELAEQMVEEFMQNTDSMPCVWVYSEKFHKGVIGLVATRLSQKYGVPAFVGAMNEETHEIVGSARAPDGGGYHLPQIMQACSEYLLRFGGHAAAAGFALSIDQAGAFGELVRKAAYEQGANPVEQVILYDGLGSLADFNSQMMSWYAEMGPFGMQFPVPSFLIENVSLVATSMLRGGHLRWTLSDPTQNSQQAMYFSPETSWQELAVGAKLDLLVEPQWNYFRGQKTIQLLVKAARQK